MHINYNRSIFTLNGDKFKISVVSEITSCVVAVTGRMMNDEGHVQPYEHDVTVTAAGAATVQYPAPGGYWIMSCMASIKTGTVNLGEILVKVELIQGDVITAVPYQLVLFGYPSSFSSVSMARTTQEFTNADVSRVRYRAPTPPAAGASATDTVTAGERWVLISVNANLTTSNAVANRHVYLELGANFQGLIDLYAPAVQAASLTRDYWWTAGSSAFAQVGTVYMIPMPAGLILAGTSTISASALLLDANDQFNYMQLTFQQLLP